MSNSPFKMPKPWLSDLVANPKKKKRLATKYGPKSTVGKRILGGVKWAGKRAFGGPVTWGLTIAELDKLKIIGTGSSLDGSAALLTMVQSDDTRRFKTSMAIPSHITVTPT